MEVLNIAVPQEIQQDRRKHKRFQVEEGGVALLTPPGPVSTVVGQLLDISISGLSFQYISDGPLSNGTSKITIASPESRFYLRELTIETVSDYEIASLPFGSLSPRRHSIKFVNLNSDQKGALQHFIQNHTDCSE